VTNTRVTEVLSLENSVRVFTEGGAVYEGDLVMGADGVHSLVRKEMWRLADLKQPGLISHREKTSQSI
jgi:FAD dependent monooxygenase